MFNGVFARYVQFFLLFRRYVEHSVYHYTFYNGAQSARAELELDGFVQQVMWNDMCEMFTPKEDKINEI